MWPELFTIPLIGISVKSYGLMVAIGFLVALWTASRRAQRHGLAPEIFSDLAIWLIVGGVVGARIFYVAQFWGEEFRGHPLDAFKIWRGGLVFYGGFLGGLAAGFYFTWRRNLSPWEIGDIVAPSVMLAYALGRVGCFLNGCCWGARTQAGGWGVEFPAGSSGGLSALFDSQLKKGWVSLGDPACLPVFPAQLLAAFCGVILFFVLDWRLQARRYRGHAFFWLLMGYPVYRFFVECFRDDTARLGVDLFDRFPGLTIAQWISPWVWLAAFSWSAWVARREKDGAAY